MTTEQQQENHNRNQETRNLNALFLNDSKIKVNHISVLRSHVIFEAAIIDSLLSGYATGLVS